MIDYAKRQLHALPERRRWVRSTWPTRADLLICAFLAGFLAGYFILNIN